MGRWRILNSNGPSFGLQSAQMNAEVCRRLEKRTPTFHGKRQLSIIEISVEDHQLSMSVSQNLTLGYAALVGLGGIMGYAKTGSGKSLVAGGLSAAALYYVYTELPENPTFASTLGLGVSGALMGVMGVRFKKTGKMFPAGVVSLVSLGMAGGYLHGIIRARH